MELMKTVISFSDTDLYNVYDQHYETEPKIFF